MGRQIILEHAFQQKLARVHAENQVKIDENADLMLVLHFLMLSCSLVFQCFPTNNVD